MSFQSQFDVVSKDTVFGQAHDVIEDKRVKGAWVTLFDPVGCVLSITNGEKRSYCERARVDNINTQIPHCKQHQISYVFPTHCLINQFIFISLNVQGLSCYSSPELANVRAFCIFYHCRVSYICESEEEGRSLKLLKMDSSVIFVIVWAFTENLFGHRETNI